MSMALVNAVTKLGKRVEHLETITPGEIKAIPKEFNPTIYDDLVMRISLLEKKIAQLEAKRKPGRPRKDER